MRSDPRRRQSFADLMVAAIALDAVFRIPGSEHQFHAPCQIPQMSSYHMRSDSDIRRDVEDELRWDPEIDPTDIAVKCSDCARRRSRMELSAGASGSGGPPRAWGGGRHQLDRSQAASRTSEIRRKIEDALRRAAEIDTTHVTVETNGGEVILGGTVRSWAQRQEAERAAWAAPGVAKVDNRIVVSR
jgi:hypothetical protein